MKDEEPLGLMRPPKFGGRKGEILNTRFADIFADTEVVSSSADRALDVLRKLAASLGALHKATVLYRLLLGRHLMAIQADEYWRGIERRDYRKDPDGTPLWISEKERTYASWYNFIEEGFEHITGLTRQTAYSAMKLAASPALAALPVEDLQNFKRLANALELVTAERRGIKITPELIAQAQEMTIESFRSKARSLGNTDKPSRKVITPPRIVQFLKQVALSDVEVVSNFWETIQYAFDSAKQDDPVRTLQEVTERIKEC